VPEVNDYFDTNHWGWKLSGAPVKEVIFIRGQYGGNLPPRDYYLRIMSEENAPTSSPTRRRFGALVTLLLASVLFCWYFDGLMLNPNQRAPTFGGDGLTIHYNLQYHATYGKGPFLTSQYYPHQESIFMTDAQGVLAVVLAELRDYFPGIAEYSAGISNVLVFWSNPLAAVLLFLLFFRLGVRPGLAVVFALLVSMLSPQIYRQVCGHYALGYSWLFPLLLLYLFSAARGWRLTAFTALMIGVIFVLGLNNPYLFAITGAFILASLGLAFLFWIFRKPLVLPSRLLHWLAVVVLSGASIMLVLASTDIVDDRVQVPYGFFTNTMKLKGLLSSPDVLGADLANWIDGNEKDPPRESRTFLGWVPMLFLLVSPMLWLLRGRLAPVRRHKEEVKEAVLLPQNPRIWLLLGSGFLTLIFSFGVPFDLFREWSYEHLGQILQFRAPARFAWPFYYALALATALTINLWWTHFSDRKSRPGQIAILLLLGVWGVQAHQYVSSSLNNRIHHNGFRPSSLAPLVDIAAEHGIDSTEFQGIFLLPTEHGWTDKLQHPGVWRSNYNGYQLSVITGLPLINGKLSRMSLAQSLASLQLVSHPLVERPLLEILDADRDVLLLSSQENELDPGEAKLFAAGTPIYSDKKLALRRISLAELRDLHRVAVDSMMTNAVDTLGRTKRHALTEPVGRTYFGNEGAKFPSGTSEIWNTPIDSTLWGDTVEVSLWTYADPSRSGGPRFNLRVFGQEDERIHKERRWTNESFDADRGWLRVSMVFAMPAGATRLALEGNFYYHYWLDEVWLRPLSEDICLEEGDQMLCNNFRVR
jgi:hypothetical protein